MLDTMMMMRDTNEQLYRLPRSKWASVLDACAGRGSLCGIHLNERSMWTLDRNCKPGTPSRVLGNKPRNVFLLREALGIQLQRVDQSMD